MADVTLTTNVTLNGETVDVTVYEDLDNTGSVDNQETVSGVADGTNTYTLSTLQGGSGNAYYVEPSLSTAAITATPIVHSASLDIPVAGSIFATENGVIQTNANGAIATQ